MSIRKIPNRYLNTTINIYRESTAVDDVGDFDVTETVPYASIPANIQPKRSELTFELQGKLRRQSHVGYLNKYDPTVREIKSGDYVVDIETGLKHLILGVRHEQTPRKYVKNSGYLRLALEHIGDSRFQYIRTKKATAKGYISTT